jgi:predicted ArsR family transcriptional regulator
MDDVLPAEKIHRALADERRARLVDELRRAPRGLDVQELSRRVTLHPNTVRWHLGILADAGIVTSRAEARSSPGRPRIVYSLADHTDVGDESGHRLLATIVTGVLAEVEDGEARAERAGCAWGRYLVRRPPGRRAGDAEAMQEVVELLTAQGFRPETDGNAIHMHHCPYRDLAPGVVCPFHLGLIAGAPDVLGSGRAGDHLDAFVEASLCTATLRRRQAAQQTEG